MILGMSYIICLIQLEHKTWNAKQGSTAEQAFVDLSIDTTELVCMRHLLLCRNRLICGEGQVVHVSIFLFKILSLQGY